MTGTECGFPLIFISPPTVEQELWPHLDTTASLNCTLQVPGLCNGNITWLKDGKAAEHLYTGQDVVWNGLNSSVKFLSSALDVNLTAEDDYGTFTCQLQNVSASFTLHKTDKAGHIAAVVLALCVLAVLVIGVTLYLKCRLNINLWYRDKYGDPEINDGRLFDACVSFCPSNIDTKFTNFILKPQLENRYGYKLHLDERSLLPSTEPSAELLMNVSRSRRLIVVLSMAYLEQEWCQNNFRDGFFRLLELSQAPIFILFENQYKDLPAEVIQLLNSQKDTLKMLMWKTDSVARPGLEVQSIPMGRCCQRKKEDAPKERRLCRGTGDEDQLMSPASNFWKELRLALPRKISLSEGRGDPQIQSQDDKDPMLTVNSEAADLDPDGDLGVRRSFYKAPPPRIAPVARVPDREPAGDVDISDLGSRNYSARADYYCLVTEPDL